MLCQQQLVVDKVSIIGGTDFETVLLWNPTLIDNSRSGMHYEVAKQAVNPMLHLNAPRN